jgi:hypothetical protein
MVKAGWNSKSSILLNQPKRRLVVLNAGRGLYLVGTLISILISLYLYRSGRRETGIFVGLWAPTVLQLGETLLRELDEE